MGTKLNTLPSSSSLRSKSPINERPMPSLFFFTPQFLPIQYTKKDSTHTVPPQPPQLFIQTPHFPSFFSSGALCTEPTERRAEGHWTFVVFSGESAGTHPLHSTLFLPSCG